MSMNLKSDGAMDAQDTKTRTHREAELSLSPVEEIVREIAAGRMVVLVDDECRENEGDLVMAAEMITPQAVNFMITHGRGLLCMPMTQQRAEELGCGPMIARNEDDFGTAFIGSPEFSPA